LIVLAVGSFSTAVTSGNYMLAVFVLLATSFGFAAYAVGNAHFRGRPDDRPEGEHQHDPPL